MRSSIVSSINPASFLTLPWAKSFLRVTHDLEDSLIQSLIPAAINRCERYGRINIVEKVFETEVDVPKASYYSSYLSGSLVDPDNVLTDFVLPRKPARSVVSITAHSQKSSLAPSVIDAANYTVRNGVLRWKETFMGLVTAHDSLVVRYTVGWPTLAGLQATEPALHEAIGHALMNAYNRGVNACDWEAAKTILNAYWSSPTYE